VQKSEYLSTNTFPLKLICFRNSAEKDAQLAEQRGLRMEQEMAYNASLAEDMERQRQEEEAQIEEAQRISMIDAKRSQKSSKKDSLPPEPGKGVPVF